MPVSDIIWTFPFYQHARNLNNSRMLNIVAKLKYKKFLNSTHLPLTHRFVRNNTTVRGRRGLCTEKKPSN